MTHVYTFSGDKNYPMATEFNSAADYGRKTSAKITGAKFLEYDRETLGIEDTLKAGITSFEALLKDAGKVFVKETEGILAYLSTDESIAKMKKDFSMTPAGMFLAGYLARADVKETVDSVKGEVKSLFDELSGCVVDGALKLDSDYQLKDKMKGVISQVVPYTAELSEKAYRTAVDTLAANYDRLGGPLQESALVQSLIKNFDSQIRLEVTLDNGTKGIVPGPDYRMLLKDAGAGKVEELVGKDVTAFYLNSSRGAGASAIKF